MEMQPTCTSDSESDGGAGLEYDLDVQENAAPTSAIATGTFK